MMEFTLSRVILCIAGVLILGALIVPVMDAFEERNYESYQDQSDRIASMFDTFYTSDVDEITIHMDRILPQDCQMGLEGNVLTLYHDEKGFRSMIIANAEPDSEMYGRGHTITLTKDRDNIVIRTVI